MEHLENLLAESIGSRVSIRLFVDGEANHGGGYRDLLGHLESANVLRKKDGTVEEFNPRHIFTWRKIVELPVRAGKGAPYSLRIHEIEEAAAKTWPARSTEEFGGWKIRISDGVTLRANSVLLCGTGPYANPGMDIDLAIKEIVKRYEEADLNATFHIPLPLYAEFDSYLAERGWEKKTSVAVMVADTARILDHEEISDVNPDLTREIYDQPNDLWLGLQGDLKVKEIMDRYPAQYLLLRNGTRVVGVGRIAFAQGWGIITRIFVLPADRRSGIARKVLIELAKIAQSQECKKIGLQVGENNESAINLYLKFGFTSHHSYCYRVLPISKSPTENNGEKCC